MSEQQDSDDPGTQEPTAPAAPVAPPVIEADQDVPPRPEEELVDEVRTERDEG